MKSIVIIVYALIAAFHLPRPDDQIPDLLIIKGDTLFLKSYPLELLDFPQRPFKYGNLTFPSFDCLRGYQATWKVIDNRLYLTKLSKINAPQESLNLEEYFLQNEYTPIVYEGFIFADWFTMSFTYFPKKIVKCATFYKTYKAKPDKPSLRFDQGILTYNRVKVKK